MNTLHSSTGFLCPRFKEKLFKYGFLLLSFTFLFFYQKTVLAQCYTSLNTSNTDIGMFQGSSTCILGNTLCLTATESTELEKALDDNYETYADWSNLVGVLGGSQGVSFKAKNGTDYSNKVVSIILSTGGGILDLGLLSSLDISLLDSGTVVSTQSYGSLLVTGGVLNGGSTVVLYVPVGATSDFDEIRIFKNSGIISALDVIRLHDVVLMDAGCTLGDNGICRDFIQGTGTIVTNSAGLLNVLGSVSDIQNIKNANSNDYASLGFTVNALNTYSLGVADLRNIYNPTGTSKAGVVIESTSSGLLDIDILDDYDVRIVTYLFGTPQDTSAIIGQGVGNSLLELSALSNLGSNKQRINFVTDKPFNEVRLEFTTAVSVTTAPELRIYGFYEEPISCSDCISRVKTSGGAINGQMMSGSSWTSGAPTLLPGLLNPGNLLDASESNYVTIGGLLGVASEVKMSVQLDSTLSQGTFVGFEIADGSTLINLSLLGNLSVETYKDSVLQQSIDASELVGLGLISGSGNRTLLGLNVTRPFDAVKLKMNTTLSLFNNLRVYNLVLITDGDNDGTPDCVDNFDCDNSMDSNNNGIPDGCDYCDIQSTVTLHSNVTSFSAGDTLEFKVAIENTGTSDAENVQVIYTNPVASSIIDWIRISDNGTTIDTFAGSGTIQETVATIVPNGSVEYYVRVHMDATTNVPYAQSAVNVMAQCTDPTPGCATCTSEPPLPRVEVVDLELKINTLSTKLHSALELDCDLVLSEINNQPTTSTVEIIIPKNALYYTLSMNTNRLTSLLNSNLTTDTNNWILDDSNPFVYILRTKPGVFINAGSNVYIPLIFTKAGVATNYELKRVQVAINNTSSGGDVNETNNATDLYIFFNVL